MYKLSIEQNCIVDRLFQLMQWLHDHEKEDIAKYIGYSNISYNSLKLCQFVVKNDLTTKMVAYCKKYNNRIKIRKNPPVEKITDILLEACKFKADWSSTPVENVDAFAMDIDSNIYSTINKGRKTEVRVGSSFQEEREFSHPDKINFLHNLIPAGEMHQKAIASPHWRKAWLKAIDIVCELEDDTFLFDEMVNNISTNKQLLLQQQQQALEEAYIGYSQRRKLKTTKKNSILR